MPATQAPTTPTYLSPRVCVKDTSHRERRDICNTEPRGKSEYTLFGLLELQSEEERGGVGHGSQRAMEKPSRAV
jgi:hypothetical protein